MNPPLDINRQNDVCLVLALGGTMKVAADFVGCTERTLYNAANRDPEFKKRLRRAKIDIELGCLKTMKKASHEDQNWRAALHLMKHLYPDRYARKADTIPVAHAKKLMDEFAKLIVSVVDDEATVRKIDQCLCQTKRNARGSKQPKRRKSQAFLKGRSEP